MADYFKVQAKGITEILNKVAFITGEMTEEIIIEVQAAAMDIQGDAREALQGGITDYGRLSQSIVAENVPDGAVLSVGSDVVYAPYIEWGTGKLVEIPQDEAAYAILFKGKGVREVNTKARPYLFPAIKKNMPLLIEKIENIIKNDT